ncbi:50S ribosomal protein L17 [bacterium]|nr:50S ribosomal protein L17 [bacterium]
MRHRKHTDKLGRKSAHRAATVSSLVSSLITHERVTTTLRLASSARRYADRMITLGKRGSLHARRQAAAFLRPSGDAARDAVSKLFTDLGPRYAERAGGYTRIYKIEPRRGDNAPMAILEFVDAKVVVRERKRKSEETEIAVETEVSGDVQEQAAAQPASAPVKEEKPAGKPVAAEKAGKPAEKEARPAAAAEEKPADKKEETPKDRKGGFGRFFKKIIGGEEEKKK